MRFAGRSARHAALPVDRRGAARHARHVARRVRGGRGRAGARAAARGPRARFQRRADIAGAAARARRNEGRPADSSQPCARGSSGSAQQHAAFGDVPEAGAAGGAARSLGRELDPADLDESFLRSIIRFRDMGAFAILGDCLAALGNRSLIDLAYESILPYQDRCGHWGLLGLRWMGPVARSLGILAAAQGRGEAANEHFAAAVETRETHGRAPVDFAHRARVDRESAALRRRAAARSSLAGRSAEPRRASWA